MTDTDLIEVTITAPDAHWLTDLCHPLIDARLASSAHIIHPITSIYRWQDTIHTASEARAVLRSRHHLLDRLTAYVIARHPYDVPSITATPIASGNPDYLDWIRTETADVGTKP